MQLAIDAGNSSIKYGLFDQNRLLKTGRIDQGESIKSILSKQVYESISTVISCSVLNDLNLKDIPNGKEILIDKNANFPFPIHYESTETLGIDRVVSCASLQSSYSDILVIDAGSCITYDFVKKGKGYLGGAISPGIEMRFRSMNNLTDKLPLISKFENNPNVIGNTTKSCMRSGIIHGINYEINGFIKYFKSKSDSIKVFLTGGDSVFLGTELKSSIFVDQDLVLKGLNSLIHLNEI
jgi:type III pantothenate kinase